MPMRHPHAHPKGGTARRAIHADSRGFRFEDLRSEIMTSTSLVQPSRRTLIAGGGALIVSFAIAPNAPAQEPPTAPTTPLPGSLKTAPMLDSWISISGDGSITVFTGKCEL